MNNPLLSKESFAQLARFKLLMRKVHRYTVDLSELSANPQYAKDTFDLAEDTDNEELMLMSIELRARLGLLKQPSSEDVTADQPKDEPKADRYRFSVR